MAASICRPKVSMTAESPAWHNGRPEPSLEDAYAQHRHCLDKQSCRKIQSVDVRSLSLAKFLSPQTHAA